MSGSSLNGEESDDEDGPEDRTADDLFQELADSESGLGTSADGQDVYEELSDESPEEIIAAADEAVEEHPVDDAILPDENALQELLLEDRTEEDGFLWIDTGGPSETGEDDPFEEDMVEEWSDAFAAASEATLTTDDRPTTDASDPDESAPEITIEVPDPEEVDGATVDDEAESRSPSGASTTGDTPDLESATTEDESERVPDDGEADGTDGDDAKPDWVTDASESTGLEETERATEDGEADHAEATEDQSEGDDPATEGGEDRIFDVEPDGEALSSSVESDEGANEAEGEDGDEATSAPADEEASDDSTPGLLSRLLSVLPF